jgi:Zn-dependent M28 family amino/carboxypeptidase
MLSCNGQNASTDNSRTDLLQQDKFDADSLLSYVRTLSSNDFEGRRTGSAGAEKTKSYIISKLKSFKILPYNGNFEQPFSFKAREKEYDAVNVIGYIEGYEHPEKYIIISAHYDHEGIKNGNLYNGADDNASGIGALLAFAEYFQKNRPDHSVIIAAFDAEELGLRGAYHFVETALKNDLNIVFNLNMDMISRSDKNEIYAVGLNHYKFLKPIVESVKLPDEMSILSGHDGFDGKQNWTNNSDHAPFHKAEIPFIYFGVEDHPDYHKPTDDFDKIPQDFYIKSVFSIISVFDKLDSYQF